MALVNCPECKAQISDRATACPQCGNPLLPPQSPAPVAAAKGGWLPWALILCACIGGLIYTFKLTQPKAAVSSVSLDKRKQVCAEAMTAAMNLSAADYAEKQAVEERVKAKCEGLDIDSQLKKP